MAAIATTEVNRYLDAAVARVAYTASTAPMKLRLYTTVGTDAAEGTPVSGGSYAAQDVDFGNAAASRAIANSAAEAFTLMPVATVTAIEIWDSNGTPVRKFWGLLAASKTTASGDTLSFAIGSIIISFA